jgi:hypothetical protein
MNNSGMSISWDEANWPVIQKLGFPASISAICFIPKTTIMSSSLVFSDPGGEAIRVAATIWWSHGQSMALITGCYSSRPGDM